MASSRADRRGHWPPAVSRYYRDNPVGEKKARTVVARLRRRIPKRPDTHPSVPAQARRSRRALAAAIGCSPRTVSRWLRGVDLPAPGSVRAIERAIQRWLQA